MKQVFRKITSLLMAFVVLLSTMSFTINMHYCGNTLVDTSVFKKAKGCGMEIQETASTSDCSVTKKNCCSNEQLVIEGQDELKISLSTFSFDQQLFIISYVYSYINLFEGLEKNVTTYTDYSPPPIVRSIYKLDETYLI